MFHLTLVYEYVCPDYMCQPCTEYGVMGAEKLVFEPVLTSFVVGGPHSTVKGCTDRLVV